MKEKMRLESQDDGDALAMALRAKHNKTTTKHG